MQLAARAVHKATLGSTTVNAGLVLRKVVPATGVVVQGAVVLAWPVALYSEVVDYRVDVPDLVRGLV